MSSGGEAAGAGAATGKERQPLAEMWVCTVDADDRVHFRMESRKGRIHHT
jgi:hypothetical protein